MLVIPIITITSGLHTGLAGFFIIMVLARGSEGCELIGVKSIGGPQISGDLML